LEPSITTIRSPRRSTEWLRPLALLLLALPLFALSPRALAAKHELLQLFVTEPYLELHTGPGRGYPVTQVVARGDSIDVLFRRTEWFKVRTERGIEGWASERDMIRTTLADGSPFKFNRGDREGFRSHHWEGGVMTGDYAGATLVEGFLARSLTDTLKIELHAGQFERLCRRPGPEPRVHAALAHLALRDAGHRRRAHRGQGHVGATGNAELPDGLRGHRRALLPGATFLSAG
jgi:Bacterial SH3 domain